MSDKHPAEKDALSEPRVEWAVEVTWLDWRKAGAKGPTSVYEPFTTTQHRDSFLEMQRRDRDITATRVLTRLAAYSSWAGPSEPEPTTEQEREALLAQHHARILGHVTPPGEGQR